MKSLFSLVAALFCTSALAEPTGTVNWLMNEPMSLFDWGIYKTDKKMADLKRFPSVYSAEFLLGSAYYDWDVNRIELLAQFVGGATEEGCIANLKKAKASFLDFKWDENEQIEAAPYVLRNLFAHEGGYKSKSTPRDLGNRLVEMTAIQALMFAKESNGNLTPKVRCRSNFRKSAVSIVRE